MTLEQLEASRTERMRLNGNGTLTFEDARTWIEETGLCLFQPRRQFSNSVAPSFVEAVAGQRSASPDPKHIALAEELLVRLETDGVAVRLNLQGHPGDTPDYIVAVWVLPYVYALRGDRDWRRSPQLTGSRQVSQLAVQAYKNLEAGDATVPELKHNLGREVSEQAVQRAIAELWQQLRIIPVLPAAGQTPKWQLLRTRYQKAIAEGASTSQVTAISVLASIYLQAVIAATMEDVEMFLVALTSRSKVREVLRGLVATRQVHSISMGHAPHFYVAGTLPEFSVAPSIYSSSSMPASSYFLHSREYEDELPERWSHPQPARVTHIPVPASIHIPAAPASTAAAVIPAMAAAAAPSVEPVEPPAPPKAPEVHAPRRPAARKPVSAAKSPAARPHFSRPAAHSRDRKPAQAASSSRSARRPASDARPAARWSSNGARPANGSRPASGVRTANGARPASGARSVNGSRPTNGSRPANGSRPTNGSRPANGARSSNGQHRALGVSGSSNGNGTHRNSNGNDGAHNRVAKPVSGARNGKPTNGSPRNGHAVAKPAAKSGSQARGGGLMRKATAPRKDARSARNGRKPALTAGAKAGNSKQYGFTAPARQSTKKRG